MVPIRGRQREGVGERQKARKVQRGDKRKSIEVTKSESGMMEVANNSEVKIMSGLTEAPFSPLSPLSPVGPGRPCNIKTRGK